MTALAMICALLALAGVVVAKTVTMELLAAHRRRLTRLRELLYTARVDLKAATNRHTLAERERRNAERKRHRVGVRIAHAKEQVGLFEFDESCRSAHFDLLSVHKVSR